MQQDWRLVKGSSPIIRTHQHTFCSFDLDLDPVTFIYELDLDILKMYMCNKTKFPGQCFQRLEPEQDRQTNRRD